MTLALAGHVFDFKVCLDLLVFTLTPLTPILARIPCADYGPMARLLGGDFGLLRAGMPSLRGRFASLQFRRENHVRHRLAPQQLVDVQVRP